MAARARLAADDELSEVVRRRLQTLLAEIPPRRAVPAQADDRAVTPPHPDDGPVRFIEPAQSRVVAPSETGDDDDLTDDIPAVRASGSQRPGWLPTMGPAVRQFVREHLVVIGIIVLSGCLWGGYSLFQARTTAVAAPTTPPSVQVSVATPSASATPVLLVHVLGEVRRPGVVTLPGGSRVQDALKAAGGLTDKAVPGDLNLAAPVSDGTQLVIGRKGSQVRASTAASGTSTAAADPTLDLNTATLEQLDTLPGVGPVTAAKILAWREAHQRFRSVAELQEVDGIGPKSYAQIASRVRV